MENIAINKRFQDLHFDSIQALRGLAALFVVFQHIRFLNFGAFGVDIFFCISGFMIMFTTEKKYKILLPETSDPNSAAVLSDDTCDLSVAVIVSIHVPADQTQSFVPGQEPAVYSF